MIASSLKTTKADEISVDLEKISSHPIDVEMGGVKVIFCIRNEKFRLPYFLDYYRRLGVTQFFAVDNNSTDDTQSYLLEQEDVHVFFTTQSYKESNAGRKWTSYLADPVSYTHLTLPTIYSV